MKLDKNKFVVMECTRNFNHIINFGILFTFAKCMDLQHV